MSAEDRIQAALEPPPDDELTAEALECAVARALAKQYRLVERERDG